MNLDARQTRAVKELVDCGAIDVLISMASMRCSIEFANSVGTITDDTVREFKAKMQAIRAFDSEILSVINEEST